MTCSGVSSRPGRSARFLSGSAGDLTGNDAVDEEIEARPAAIVRCEAGDEHLLHLRKWRSFRSRHSSR